VSYGISVTCHQAVVTFPSLPQPKLVLDLAPPEGCKTESSTQDELRSKVNESVTLLPVSAR